MAMIDSDFGLRRLMKNMSAKQPEILNEHAPGFQEATSQSYKKVGQVFKSLREHLQKLDFSIKTDTAQVFAKKVKRVFESPTQRADSLLRDLVDAIKAKDIEAIANADRRIGKFVQKHGHQHEASRKITAAYEPCLLVLSSMGTPKTVPSEILLSPSLGPVTSSPIQNFLIRHDFGSFSPVKPLLLSKMLSEEGPIKEAFDRAYIGDGQGKQAAAEKVLSCVLKEIKEDLGLRGQHFPATMEARADFLNTIAAKLESVSMVAHADTFALQTGLTVSQELAYQDRFKGDKLAEGHDMSLYKRTVATTKLSHVSQLHAQEQQDTSLSVDQKNKLAHLRQTQVLQTMAMQAAYFSNGLYVDTFDLPVGNHIVPMQLQEGHTIELSGESDAIGHGVQVQVYTPVDGDAEAPVFINVRGTANPGNIMDDLHLKGPTHSLMHEEPGRSSLGQLEEILRKEGLQGRPIVVSGHSLGGGVATSLAIRYDNQVLGEGLPPVRIQKVVAFNGAGVGQSMIDESVEKNVDRSKITNVVNAGDIIPYGAVQIGHIERLQSPRNPGVHYTEGHPTVSDVIAHSDNLLAQHSVTMLTEAYGGDTVVGFHSDPQAVPTATDSALNNNPILQSMLHRTVVLGTSGNVAHRSAQDGISKTRLLNQQSSDLAALKTKVEAKTIDTGMALRIVDVLARQLDKIQDGVAQREANGRYGSPARAAQRDWLMAKISENQVEIAQIKETLLAQARAFTGEV